MEEVVYLSNLSINILRKEREFVLWVRKVVLLVVIYEKDKVNEMINKYIFLGVLVGGRGFWLVNIVIFFVGCRLNY